MIVAEDELAHLVPDDVRVVRFGDEFEAMVAAGDSQPFALDARPGSRFSYTSGTTGHPKGVKRAIPDTLDAMLAVQRNAGHDVAMTGDGVHLVTGPAYHAAVGGFAFFDLCNGATLRIMRRFDAARTLELIETESVRRTHLVPTMMVRMLRLGEAGRLRDLSSLDIVLHGAAPIAPAVKQQMIEWLGPILVEYWGTSEAGVFTESTATTGSPVRARSAGRCRGSRSLRSMRMAMCSLRVRSDGCSATPLRSRNRSPTGMLRRRPLRAISARVCSRLEIWGTSTRTDGSFFADRATNMIITGGVNVYPAEVEQALLEHPAVVDVAVFGIPDDEWGEQVKAAVEFSEGATIDVDELLAFARSRLGRHKVPRSIDVHEALPRQPNGKLYLDSLRAPYWVGRERKI